MSELIAITDDGWGSKPPSRQAHQLRTADDVTRIGCRPDLSGKRRGILVMTVGFKRLAGVHKPCLFVCRYWNVTNSTLFLWYSR